MNQAVVNGCEHHFESRVRGGHPLYVRLCTLCRAIDWADLDRQAGELRAAASAVVAPPTDRAELRERIAAAMREHWLCTIREEADADGNLPCRCGGWREPGAEVDDENDWDSHLADVALAVLGEQTDRAAVLREAIDVAREEGHRLEEQVGIEAARGARSVAYLLRKLLAKEGPRRLAVEAQGTGTQQPEAAHRQTVEYFVQSQQPDGTWEDATSMSMDRGFATDRLTARRQRRPDCTFRLAQRTTTVVVQPLVDDVPAPVAQQPAAEAWVCKCPAGLCGCGHHAPAEQQAAAADGEETPFVPPAHYVRDDGVECCVHTTPVGPDSCRACRELADD